MIKEQEQFKTIRGRGRDGDREATRAMEAEMWKTAERERRG